MPGVLLPLLLVLKKSGEMRPILNLRVFNKSVARRTRKFRMLTVRALLQCVREGDWFTSLVLKDAYFHVPIFKTHRKFLCFAFMGMAYEYWCLPFGYSLAPHTFSKCVEAALGSLRHQGKIIIFYLDNLLVLSHSGNGEKRHHGIDRAPFPPGLCMNWEKKPLHFPAVSWSIWVSP